MTLWLGWVFLLYELVQLVLFCYIYLYYKNETKRTEVVDGSNESLYHADEEMHPLVRNFSPSQTIFNKFNLLPSIPKHDDGIWLLAKEDSANSHI